MSLEDFYSNLEACTTTRHIYICLDSNKDNFFEELWR